MLQTVWQEFLTIMREEVGSRVVETWLKAVSFEQWERETKTVCLKAPNRFVKDWVSKNYLTLFQIHFGRLLHVEAPHILFVEEEEKRGEASAEKKELLVVPTPEQKAVNSLVPVRKPTPCLNSSYTFDSFIIGPSNSLAYAAAHAITEKPGILYNPLFIYGGSGLGKTHLLHAIGNQIKETHKGISLVYQTADRFVNEFIGAIRFNKMDRFKLKYQKVDVLLIDDLQFISNKEQTQEAFFHIFNSLYDARKQIVFSSDTYPQDMNGIAERLRSRIIGGLVTDIHRPSLETKIAILKKKAALHNTEIPDEVAHFIATHVISNTRELEGALIRVIAFGTLTKKAITIELAQRVLVRFVEQKNKSVDCSTILAKVAGYFNVDLKTVYSKNRNKDLTHVRHVSFYLMKKLTEKSLRDIGECIGGRDHSTVMHGIEKIDHAIKQDTVLAQEIAKIEKLLLE